MQAEPGASEDLLTAMLACCATNLRGPGELPDLMSLMPLYDMARTASRGQAPHPHRVEQQQTASSLAAVISRSMCSASPLEQAAAALCCGGALEGAASRGSSSAAHDQQTANTLANTLAEACTEAVAAAEGVPHGQLQSGWCLRRDALGLSSWKAQQACGLPQVRTAQRCAATSHATCYR